MDFILSVTAYITDFITAYFHEDFMLVDARAPITDFTLLLQLSNVHFILVAALLADFDSHDTCIVDFIAIAVATSLIHFHHG